ncbi:MAG: class I SAM-dependent methyltransferase [Brasilonema octagenarum HA4186-MV1]|jgi:ubiquinone/menaquinone biosynthesis C-methylase UbiE|nr:class I SAM-dependent methyltransferase [Brasilonema octagenarum HA4186-MV1]
MNKENDIENYYDKYSEKYDEVAKSPECKAQFHNEAKKIFRKYNHQTGSILDVGCGTGLLSDVLEGNFEYTGIDVSGGMLKYASERGYKTIHQTIEDGLPKIESKSYDFVVSLSALFLVEDIHTSLNQINRIARKAILIGLDRLTDDYIKNAYLPVYDHSQVNIPNTLEDYFILGWISPTLGTSIYTRMIYVEPD